MNLHNPTSESAVDWLIKHAELAMQAPTFAEFCDSEPRMGQYYKRYQWLGDYWATLKYKGTILWKPLLFPQACKVGDLFESVELRTKSRERPPGLAYLTEPYQDRGKLRLAGNYGGRRGWSEEWKAKGKMIRCHYGSDWWGLWCTPKAGIVGRLWANSIEGGKPQVERCSFEIINWDDGRLVTGRAGEFSSRWLALLDLDEKDTLYNLLPKAQQVMVDQERVKIKEAWGDEEERS